MNIVAPLLGGSIPLLESLFDDSYVFAFMTITGVASLSPNVSVGPRCFSFVMLAGILLCMPTQIILFGSALLSDKSNVAPYILYDVLKIMQALIMCLIVVDGYQRLTSDVTIYNPKIIVDAALYSWGFIITGTLLIVVIAPCITTILNVANGGLMISVWLGNFILSWVIFFVHVDCNVLSIEIDRLKKLAAVGAYSTDEYWAVFDAEKMYRKRSATVWTTELLIFMSYLFAGDVLWLVFNIFQYDHYTHKVDYALLLGIACSSEITLLLFLLPLLANLNDKFYAFSGAVLVAPLTLADDQNKTEDKTHSGSSLGDGDAESIGVTLLQNEKLSTLDRFIRQTNVRFLCLQKPIVITLFGVFIPTTWSIVSQIVGFIVLALVAAMKVAVEQNLFD